MSVVTRETSTEALLVRRKIHNKFFRKGIIIGISSGMCYATYTALMTLGMTKGVWAEWYGPETILSVVAITYLVGALGSTVNDLVGAIWALGSATLRGKLIEVFRVIKSKPGGLVVASALLGGPIAGIAYVIALQLAGSIIAPISALCPAIGVILGRIFFRQKITPRICLGLFICLGAGFLIASTSLSAEATEGMFLGVCIGLIAAFGWGFEGCVGGYALSLVDSEVAIAIRQLVSGLTGVCIFLPIISLIVTGNVTLAPELTFEALTSGPAMIFFVGSGLFGALSYMLWYKGSSMCGTALGMSCNAMYSFWTPLFCWIILGGIAGIEGWGMPPIAWVGAVVMVIGIFIIAMNPLDLLKKGDK